MATSNTNDILFRLIKLWAWLFLAVLIIIFIFAVPMFSGPNVSFLSIRNSQNILVAITPVLLLGLGQTFVIISGGIDLSVGWTMSFASVVSALALREAYNLGLPVSLAVLVGFLASLLCGLGVGLFNGTLIAKLKVPPFIVTLGSAFILRGLALLSSENTTVIGLPPAVRAFGNEAVFYLVRGESEYAGFYFLTKPDLPREVMRELDRIISYPVLITAIVVGLAIYLLKATKFGRYTYAIGGNAEAAKRSGIPVENHIIRLYILASTTASIGGFLSVLRFTAGSAVIGDPLLLSSIAAVIIGGVSLFGGSGTVVGTIIGALIIAVLTTGLVMLNVAPFWQFIVVGSVVILAVLIDQSRDAIKAKLEARS